MDKKLSIQQAYLDGWETCRLTMLAKLQEMLAAKRIIEEVTNSIEQVRVVGMNPTGNELDDYQNGGFRKPNKAIRREFEHG